MDCTPILDTLARRVPRDQNTYIAPDGILRCTNCHGSREVAIELPGMGRKVVPCICRCMARQRDQELQRLRDQETCDRIQRLRSLGFQERTLAEASFDRDDRKNPIISDALRRYAEHFADLRREGRGLLLYGPVGTGKTYYAACVVNEVIRSGCPALMTSFPRLINQVSGAGWADRQPMLDRLTDFSLVALDDFGIERQTDYTLEQMTMILDTLYRAGTPLIITTNADPSRLSKATDIRTQRIWDRILERCHPIAVTGESRRRGKGQENFRQGRELLGI